MYFDYVASQITVKSISSLCSAFSDMKDLSDSAHKLFCDKNVTSDWYAENGVLELLGSYCAAYSDHRNDDFSMLYQRCMNGLQRSNIPYDRLFELMVDCCWLLASVQGSKEHGLQKISLLADPNQFRFYLKHMLTDLYSFALSNSYEAECVAEAEVARGKVFAGLYLLFSNSTFPRFSHFAFACFEHFAVLTDTGILLLAEYFRALSSGSMSS